MSKIIASRSRIIFTFRDVTVGETSRSRVATKSNNGATRWKRGSRDEFNSAGNFARRDRSPRDMHPS